MTILTVFVSSGQHSEKTKNEMVYLNRWWRIFGALGNMAPTLLIKGRGWMTKQRLELKDGKVQFALLKQLTLLAAASFVAL